MEKRWETKDISLREARYLSQLLNLPLSIAKLLVSIGLSNPKEAMEFLKPDFRTLHNPFLMLDMEKAVQRIIQAVDNKEKIMIHGDYDADGVTTISLFVECFKLLGVEVDYYAPNRFTDGYGLHPRNMTDFANEYDLIISGDTGIKAFPAGEIVKKIGKADLIITDHHEPLEGSVVEEIYDAISRKTEAGKTLSKKYSAYLSKKDLLLLLEEETKIEMLYELEIVPKNSTIEIKHGHFIALPFAHSIINPKRLGDVYPCKSLSGVAVVFKLFQAVFIEKNMSQKPLLAHLDIVATGLIADLVQQIDRKENIHGVTNDFEVRTMTAFGLKIMNKSPKTWVKVLAEIQGIKLDQEEIMASHLGFRFGPMLNAPGRLEDPTPSVELLLEKDIDKARIIAEKVKELNTLRQEQTSSYKLVSDTLKQKGEEYYDYGIAVQSDEFHIGIAGLIAGKLCEEFYRPSIALAPVEKDGKTVLKGSARSIPGISVYKILGEVQKDIGPFEHGGHEQAAGLTLMPEQFDDFQKAFRKYCMKYPEEMFVPLFKYDAEINLEDILEHEAGKHLDVTEYPFMKFLSMLEPFGQENREPIFRANNVKIESLDPIMEGKGSRLTFKTNRGVLKGIMFKFGETVIPGYEADLKTKGECIVDILFSPQINVWNGNKSIQLMMQDIKFKD